MTFLIIKGITEANEIIRLLLYRSIYLGDLCILTLNCIFMHRNIEREHLKEEHKVRVSHEEKINNVNSTKDERDILARDVTSMESASQKSEEGVKSKRSVSERTIMDFSTDKSSYQHDNRHHARRTIVSRTHPYTNGESKTNDDPRTNTAIDLTT